MGSTKKLMGQTRVKVMDLCLRAQTLARKGSPHRLDDGRPGPGLTSEETVELTEVLDEIAGLQYMITYTMMFVRSYGCGEQLAPGVNKCQKCGQMYNVSHPCADEHFCRLCE